MYKGQIIVLAGALFFILSAGSVSSSKLKVPSKDIDMHLDLPADLELGQEYAVNFKFTPREEIEHRNDLDDLAKISVPPGIEIVSGTPQWKGRLLLNKTETIQVVIKVTQPGRYTLHGVVKSCAIDTRHIQEDPQIHRLKPRVAETVFGEMFRYRNVVSQSFQVGEGDGLVEVWSVDGKTGEVKRLEVPRESLKDKLPEGPPPRGNEDIRTIGNDLHSPTQEHDRGEPREYGFRIVQQQPGLKEENALSAGAVRLGKGESATIFLFEGEEKCVAEAEFSVTGDCCELTKLPTGKAIVTGKSQTGRCKIIATYRGVKYLINVFVVANPTKEPTTAPQGWYKYDGVFKYVNNWEEEILMAGWPGLLARPGIS